MNVRSETACDSTTGRPVWRRLPACVLPSSLTAWQAVPHALVLAGLLLTVTNDAAVGAAVEVRENEQYLTISTPAFHALFDRQTGGLLRSLRAASGQELIRDSTVYSDLQMQHPREYFGSRHDPQATLGVERLAGKTVVTARGRLVNAAGVTPEGMPFSYEIRYTFDASSRFSVDAKITVGFDQPKLRGFLAHTVFLAAQREFFANTADGRICELAPTASRRTWQSVREPLSATAPWLGVVLAKGLVLKFTLTTESTPLQNVFFHDSGKGLIII